MFRVWSYESGASTMIAAKFSEVFSGKGTKRREAINILKTKFPDAKWFGSTALLNISEDEAKIMPGICEFGEVTVTKVNLNEIKTSSLKYADKLFWINVSRKGQHDFTSLDIAKDVGTFLEKKGFKASSKGTIINILIYNDTALIYKKNEGPGGLPSGLLGKVLVIWENNYQSQMSLLKVASRGFTPIVLCPKGTNPCCGEKIEYDFKTVFNTAGFALKDMRGPLLKLFVYKLAKKIKANLGVWFVVSSEIFGSGLSGDIKLLKKIEDLSDLKPLRPIAFENKVNVLRLANKFGFNTSTSISEWRRFRSSELNQEWITLELDKPLKDFSKKIKEFLTAGK